MNVISMISHRMTDVTMTSVSMARKDEAESIEFFDKLIGDGTAYILFNNPNIRSNNGNIYEYKYTACPKDGNGYVYGARYTNNGAYLDTVGFVKQNGQNYCGPVALRSSYVNHYNYVFGHKYESVIISGASGSLVCTDLNTAVKRTYSGVSYPNGAIAIFAEFSFDIATSAWAEITGHRDSGIFWGLVITNKTTNSVVVDLRPCTYNGEAGMYDVINNVFYGNANSDGELTVAND